MEVEAVVAEDDTDDDNDDDEAAAAPAVEVVAAEADEDNDSRGNRNDDDDDNNDDDDEEDDVVVAATVLPEEDEGDDDDEAAAEVAAVAEAPSKPKLPPPPPPPAKKTPPSKKKKPAPKKKTPESSTSGTTKKDGKGTSTAGAAKKKKKKASPAAGNKASSSSAAVSSAVTEVWPVNPKRVDLARDARDHLHEMVQYLPLVLAETQVRSLGRLKLSRQRSTPFCTTAALYPIGFSCDRYEFSPIHGRLMQLRCTILDAAQVRQLQKDKHVPSDRMWPKADGPIFRVMWGLGVEEDKWADRTQIPFQAEPPLGGPPVKRPPMRPVVEQRVRVRFERREYHPGTITAVTTAGKSFKISIQYDDGSSEKDAPFPDPDITLVTPGTFLFCFFVLVDQRSSHGLRLVVHISPKKIY